MFACTKFRRNWSHDIGFRARKPPQKFGVKEVVFTKCHKQYFTLLYISRYSFIPTNSLLVAMRIFPFFQNIVRSSSKRHTTEKKKLHHMCYCDVQTIQTKSTMYKQCKQNSRDFAKKPLVVNLDPPKVWRNRRAHRRRFFVDLANSEGAKLF